MSIRVTEVSKYYGKQKALDSVSFEAKPGEIVGFLGPNGAGKSTMMKIICGYIPQNQGDVEVCGLNVLESEMEIKKLIGYLPENNPLYLEMYVKEYLDLVSGIFKIENKDERIAEIIQLVGLEKEQHKKIGALSKGYRQRVGLAQAFVHDPEVLILDEPTTGLDPNQILEIRDLIRQIGKNKTVLLSTHIMQEVEAICDRAIIINEGKIVADQPIADLKKIGTGHEKLLVEFVQEINKKEMELAFSSFQLNALSNKKIEMSAPDLTDLKKKLMKYAIDKELEIVSMSEEVINLENIFRNLTLNKKE